MTCCPNSEARCRGMCMVDLTDILNRICALEQEGMLAASPSVGCKAVPRFIYTQEDFPYWTNRVAQMTADDDSQDFRVYEYDITARLVIGHVTQGYRGQNDALLQAWLPHMIQWFDERELLQSTTYADAPETPLLRATVVGMLGFREFMNNSIGQTIQVGAEITIRCRFEEAITQAYF